MKCPKCDFQISGIVCEACGEETPEESLYCYKCGAEIDVEQEGSFDLESRILCGDETCTGVINEKGFCGVCGKPGVDPSPEGT